MDPSDAGRASLVRCSALAVVMLGQGRLSSYALGIVDCIFRDSITNIARVVTRNPGAWLGNPGNWLGNPDIWLGNPGIWLGNPGVWLYGTSAVSRARRGREALVKPLRHWRIRFSPRNICEYHATVSSPSSQRKSDAFCREKRFVHR
eukprot:1179099-Prorocentrum_minimum.AAC.1